VQLKTQVPIAIPLSATIAEAIGEYLSAEGRPVKAKTDFIFVAQRFPFIKLTSLSDVFIAYRDAAGLDFEGEHMGFHAIRRMFAKDHLEAGATVKAVADLLGQTDINSTVPPGLTEFTWRNAPWDSSGCRPQGRSCWLERIQEPFGK
jgi:site-specific recombinase XerD